MKKILGTILLICSILQSQGQNLFEGTIRWNVKTDYADIVQEATTKQLIADLTSPEGKKKMQAAQERMKDPAFKKYLETNPTLKAQMERGFLLMKAMEQYPGEDPLKVMMPKIVTLQIKDTSALIRMEGGISSLLGNMLRDSTGKKYSVMEKEKTYSKVPDTKDSAVLRSKITGTKETEEILGYGCKKYIIVTNLNGKTVQQIIWTTKEVKPFNTKILSDLLPDAGKTGIDFSWIEGVPLKMVITTESLIVTLTAFDLENEVLQASLFRIPKEFKEVPYIPFGK